VPADVPLAQRAVEGVRHRVQKDVPVGVAEKPAGVRDAHPPEPQFPPGHEAVGVASQPDPEVRLLHREPVGHAQVRRHRDLDVLFLAGHGRHGMPQRLHEGGAVGARAPLRRRLGV